ncbi:MAG: endo-1,4-beta-xylanase [Cyclobacteriaceae bacterium]|nr:endo-1,4-beta-xylanase [Cyclobacteriaceae bacterium]
MKVLNLQFIVCFLIFIACKPAYKPTESLKEKYKGKFFIGTALNLSQIQQKNKEETTLILREFNSITAENIMKWALIHPKPNEYQFGPVDEFVNFGKQNNMFVIGHTLLWHQQVPSWVYQVSEEDTSLVDKETLYQRVKEHVDAVAGRYRGKIDGWDVLNEALEENGSLRNSAFLKIAGEEYIEKVFEYASLADPEAELYYNDYNMWKPEKRDGAIRLIQNLLDKGIKVDGIGMQGHWALHYPSPQQIEESIVKFSELGLKVMITELDITVLPNPWDIQGADLDETFDADAFMNPYTEGLPDSVSSKLEKRYEEIFQLFEKQSDKISRVTFWGVHDGVSWLNNWPARGRTNYPLLFDRNLQRKSVYEQILNQ